MFSFVSQSYSELINLYDLNLVADPDSIRLLSLEPADSDEADLHATILTARLGESPTYEALSYVWGEDVFTETLHLIVGNHASFEIRSKVQITQSLASALRAFHRKTVKRFLWVDAVCINQRDHLEKGHQILLMKDIYTQAKQVLIWLGDATEHTTSAFEYARKMALLAEEFDVQPRSRYIPFSSYWLKGDR